jgi:L-lysine 2,3-aminomutase
MKNTLKEKTKVVPFTTKEVEEIMHRFHYCDEVKTVIRENDLLPTGLITRLHHVYPQYSGFREKAEFLFNEKKHYSGLEGFREIVRILGEHGIEIGHQEERELFIKVYRFMATKHVLNTINWADFKNDSVFQLVFPQPGMIRPDIAKAYLAAKSEVEKERIVQDYIRETNPHDGKQQLNKPTFINEDGEIEVVEGSQHKYPQVKLVFDQQTQNCFAFCNYCFRHAQVRGDDDMFIQKDVHQVHEYLKVHKEVTDILITGGDAGFLKPDRFEAYITPIIEDPELNHIKNIRLGTRVLTFDPEMILTPAYDRMLKLFRRLYDNGIQLLFMSHFSTPRELMNPSTIAAIRRIKATGASVRSQSPVMTNISLFLKENGEVDVDRSAKNWIDLGNLLSMVGVGFHSMYCARPTGEHHYFTQPLAQIEKVFYKVYRDLPSISRPSRYITMTASAGKISLLGTVEIAGEKLFALKFNEGRNMEWMDKVYLAHYDEKENTIINLKPYRADKHFFEDELAEIERKLHESIQTGRGKKSE